MFSLKISYEVYQNIDQYKLSYYFWRALLLSKLKDQDLTVALKALIMTICLHDPENYCLLEINLMVKISWKFFTVHTVAQVHRTYRVTIERLDPCHAQVVESWVDLLASEAITYVDYRLCKQTKIQSGEIFYKGPFSFLCKLANTDTSHDQFSGSSSMDQILNDKWYEWHIFQMTW